MKKINIRRGYRSRAYRAFKVAKILSANQLNTLVKSGIKKIEKRQQLNSDELLALLHRLGTLLTKEFQNKTLTVKEECFLEILGLPRKEKINTANN
jgi:hypothetical protein